MSSISEQLDEEYSKAAAMQSVVDLGDLGEKLSIETVASCTFGVKAGAFQSQGCNSIFCHRICPCIYPQSYLKFGDVSKLVVPQYQICPSFAPKILNVY